MRYRIPPTPPDSDFNWIFVAILFVIILALFAGCTTEESVVAFRQEEWDKCHRVFMFAESKRDTLILVSGRRWGYCAQYLGPRPVYITDEPRPRR